MSNVLVIAAHPDDEVLGVGGTILKHLEGGDDVFIFILGEGVAARHGDGAVEKIKFHAIEAARILGVKKENVSFGGYLYDNRFNDTLLTKVIVEIEKKIKEINPEIIYTHHYGDANTDHELVYRATMSAVRPISGCNKNIKRVLSYEVVSSTEQSFQLPKTAFLPNVYVDISKWLDKKIEAINCYLSEVQDFPHPRSKEGIRSLAAYRGLCVKKPAAEAFMLMIEVS